MEWTQAYSAEIWAIQENRTNLSLSIIFQRKCDSNALFRSCQHSLMTFLFLWKGLVLNKSYSSCSRGFTQGKCYTLKINRGNVNPFSASMGPPVLHRQSVAKAAGAHWPAQAQPTPLSTGGPADCTQQKLLPNSCYLHPFQGLCVTRPFRGTSEFPCVVLVPDAHASKTSVVPHTEKGCGWQWGSALLAGRTVLGLLILLLALPGHQVSLDSDKRTGTSRESGHSLLSTTWTSESFQHLPKLQPNLPHPLSHDLKT